MIETTVAQCSKEPQSEIRPIAARGEIGVGAHKRVLNHVCGHIMIAHHRHGVPIHRHLVTTDELRELVDVTIEHSGDDDGIVD